MASTLRQKLLLKFANYWPPYLGAGVSIDKVADDMQSIDVKLKMRPWNKNYVGTHFGGSIYSMTDPFFMIILMENLGRDYIVWDKEATVRFKKPGKGTLTAHFNISAERIQEIKEEADNNYKTEPEFTVEVKNEFGEVVAEVDKVLYVRRKDRQPTAGVNPVPPPPQP